MAIYKNREVGIISPMYTAQPPKTIIVQYKDGTHENVSLSLVRFTDEEKKTLIKNYPSEFDTVEVATSDDIAAVRLGLTPPSDPEHQRIAEAKVYRAKIEEENQKITDKAKKDAEAKIKEVESKPTPATVTPGLFKVK